ncbi:MAG TPA: threonine/serine dehydratase [Hyphomicrobiales bacterium]|nr:threonine/serine dehydratase [Hyphomicrobiales bacterium]
MNIPTIADIVDADGRIRPHALETPLLECPVLNDRLEGRAFCKAEILQRTGSFKFRGAYNRISRISRDEYPGGVVACSSGNHAQGVAEAARLCGLSAVIVMPSDAPKLKIARTSRSGAEIVFYNRETEDRNAIAKDLCAKLNAVFVPPFDDPYVIAGQGTVGLELTRQAKAASAEIDAVLVPASGGGLTAGVALAVKDRFPSAEIYCVEPKGFDDYGRSLAAGSRKRNDRASGSICDALLMQEPGELTFSINKELLAGGLAVSDEEVREAMAFAFRELKLVIEPGGSVALAALLSGAFQVKGRNVAVVLSGGNVDGQLFADIISGINELA